MNRIHVECKPDTILVKKLGFSKKEIFDQGDKSRVYQFLKKETGQVAMVDEDPNPNPGASKYSYENGLTFLEEKNGISRYVDKTRNNTVLILKGKLEDWLISICKRDKIDITSYGLPAKSNELHNVINNRLSAYEKLLDDLLAKNSESLLILKNWLKSN